MSFGRVRPARKLAPGQGFRATRYRTARTQAGFEPATSGFKPGELPSCSTAPVVADAVRPESLESCLAVPARSRGDSAKSGEEAGPGGPHRAPKSDLSDTPHGAGLPAPSGPACSNTGLRRAPGYASSHGADVGNRADLGQTLGQLLRLGQRQPLDDDAWRALDQVFAKLEADSRRHAQLADRQQFLGWRLQKAHAESAGRRPRSAGAGSGGCACRSPSGGGLRRRLRRARGARGHGGADAGLGPRAGAGVSSPRRVARSRTPARVETSARTRRPRQDWRGSHLLAIKRTANTCGPSA